MRRLVPWAAVFLAGLVIGVGGLRLVETFTVDRELALHKAELIRLTGELRDRSEALEALQAQLRDQADRIHAGVVQALDEADRVLAAQGSVVERLRLVVATLRKLRAHMETPGSN